MNTQQFWPHGGVACAAFVYITNLRLRMHAIIGLFGQSKQSYAQYIISLFPQSHLLLTQRRPEGTLFVSESLAAQR